MDSFLKRFTKATGEFGAHPFVVVYGPRGERTQATFGEFRDHVAFAAKNISTRARDAATVATVAGNSYLNLVYMSAAILSGRTLCPMNPAEGAERNRARIAALAEPSHVLTEAEMEIGESKDESFFRPFPGDRAMILIFTSGSTGYGKIVEQTELGILTNADALIAHHRLNSESCIGTPLPIFHVNALEFSFMCSLLSGARLVLWDSPSAAALAEGLRDEKCTIASVVPPILRALVRRPNVLKNFPLPALKYWVSAAAPLSIELALDVVSHTKHRVIQGYGLSEAVNFSCTMPIDLLDKDYMHWLSGENSPSIGTALSGSEVNVLDDAGKEQQPGDLGEICVRGPTLMRGYRGETRSSVITDGTLRTGDLGFFKTDAQGRRFYFITGRKKEIAKRNGITVSLREIDDVMAAFVNTEMDSIALAFANDISGEEVGAVVSSTAPFTDEIKHQFAVHLETKLPPHLRPSLIIHTTQGLRTASGKPRRHPFTAWFTRFQKLSLGTRIQFFAESECNPNADDPPTT